MLLFIRDFKGGAVENEKLENGGAAEHPYSEISEVTDQAEEE